MNARHYNTQHNFDHDLLCSNFYTQTHYSILFNFTYCNFRYLEYGFPYWKIGNYSTGCSSIGLLCLANSDALSQSAAHSCTLKYRTYASYLYHSKAERSVFTTINEDIISYHHRGSYSGHLHLGNGARYDESYCYSLIGSHGTSSFSHRHPTKG